MTLSKAFSRILLLLLLSMPLLASALTAGTDYAPLDRPVPADSRRGVEVVEVFSFSCPHCYELEPALKTWLAKNRGKVNFVALPVVASPNSEPLARAFYAAQVLGKEWPYREALFNAIHKEGQDWRNSDTLLKAAAKVGLDPKKFEATMNSFTVQTRVNHARQLTEAYGITGVPTMVVAGQYRTSPAYTNGDNVRMLGIVDELVRTARPTR